MWHPGGVLHVCNCLLQCAAGFVLLGLCCCIAQVTVRVRALLGHVHLTSVDNLLSTILTDAELTEAEDEDSEDGSCDNSKSTASSVILVHHQLNVSKDRTKNAAAAHRNAMLLEIRRNTVGLRTVDSEFERRAPKLVQSRRTRLPSPLSKSSVSKSSLSSMDSVSSVNQLQLPDL